MNGDKAFLTVAEMTRLLEVTTQAVYLWRMGSPTRRPLPVHSIRRGKSDRIFIDSDELLNWLANHRPDLLEKLAVAHH